MVNALVVLLSSCSGMIGEGLTFVEVGGEGSSRFARREDGAVFGWGSNSEYGILACDPEECWHVTRPRQLPLPVAAATLAPWNNGGCVLDADGAAWCWGQNATWSIVPDDSPNLQETVAYPEPVPVPSAGPWAKIVPDYTTVALDSDGRLWAWGVDPTSPRVDTWTRLDAHLPLEPESRFTDISAPGHGFACGLREDGAVRCWGDAQYGLSRSGTTTTTLEPGARLMGARWGLLCAIRPTGIATCRLPPTRSDGPQTHDWVALDTSPLQWMTPHGLALDEAGALYRFEPLSFADEALDGWELVDAGPWVSATGDGDGGCGVRTDGTVWCWGHGNAGELGNGRQPDRSGLERVAF